MSENKWKREYLGGIDYSEHLGGVTWHDAPIPRRWHRCKVQTRGCVGLNCIERCACGAIKVNGGWWHERNSRRKHEREKSHA